ncbi:MAG: hypothetical protein ACWA5U_05900 [bacterium]
MLLNAFGFIVVILALYAIFKSAQLLMKNETHTGIKRLAYAISGLWIGIPLGLMFAKAQFIPQAIDPEAWITWFFLALLPNILFWLIIWVLKGFRQR